MTQKMVKEIVMAVEAMKVADMRKVAPKFGIKNAKQYKREQLSQMLINAMVAKKRQEVEAKKKAAAKKPEKVTKKATNKEQKSEKRYKAAKVDNVEELANEILNATPAEVEAMDLYSVNRKVLIEVMKQLHCKLWYRTYDKPTMINKITETLAA